MAVFSYLDSALHRSRGAAGSTPDQYMRAGTRWVLIAYSLPLIVAVALAVLPWILGGGIPSRTDFVPLLLLALAIGFTSTATVIMSVFDAQGDVGVGGAVATLRDS